MTSAERKQEMKLQDGRPQPQVLHGHRFKQYTEIQRLSTREKIYYFHFCCTTY